MQNQRIVIFCDHCSLRRVIISSYIRIVEDILSYYYKHIKIHNILIIEKYQILILINKTIN